ncbi:MAG: outer membrane lipoprotein-sorting protein [Myxococcota bacterium]
MRVRIGRRAAGALLGLLLLAAPVLAEGPSGDALVQQVNQRDEGRFATSRVAMQLIDRRGNERERVARFFRMNEGDDRKLAVFYESPRTIRDTAFLTFDYAEAGREDDQWLYLPALRRSRRIASADRGGAFLGTDLSYEEVKKGSRIAVEDYGFERTPAGDGEVDGHACLAVTATPVDDRVSSELGYSRVEYCIDPEIRMVRRSKYWNRAGRHLKTVRAGEIRPVDGIWTTHRIHVVDHLKDHQTVFEFDEVEYPDEIDERLFTERRLRQGWR